MAWPTYTADVTQNSNQITIYGAVPAADIPVGDEVIVYGATTIDNLEIASGSAIMYDNDGAPYSHLYLTRPYTGLSATGIELIIKPTGSLARDVVEVFRNGSTQISQTMSNFNQFVEGDTPVQHQPIDQNADPINIKTLVMMNNEHDTQINTNQQAFDTQYSTNQDAFDSQLQQQQSDVNELLANKTADGNDTTPGALLQVGATVKQLDTTNSNVRFVASKPPYSSCDFVNQIYREYDGISKGVVDKTFYDIVDFSRGSGKTGSDIFGDVATALPDEPVFEYRDGEAIGMSIFNFVQNKMSWSETNGVNYPIGDASRWLGQQITIAGIVLDEHNHVPVTSKDFLSTSKSATASIYFFDPGDKSSFGRQPIFRFECHADSIAFYTLYYDYSTGEFDVTGNANEYFDFEIEDLKPGFYRVALKCIESTLENIYRYRVAVYSEQTGSWLGGGNLTETPYLAPYIKSTEDPVSTLADNPIIRFDRYRFDYGAVFSYSFLCTHLPATGNYFIFSVEDIASTSRYIFQYFNPSGSLVTGLSGSSVSSSGAGKVVNGVNHVVLRCEVGGGIVIFLNGAQVGEIDDPLELLGDSVQLRVGRSHSSGEGGAFDMFKGFMRSNDIYPLLPYSECLEMSKND